MNKSKLNKIVFILVIINVIFFTIFSIITYRRVQPVPQTKTITVTDTITNVVYDTVFIDHFETVKLPTTDTTVYYIADTVTRVDSVFVEVPISKYSVDTTFVTDTTVFNLSIRNSGYAVTLDTLSYSFTYRPTKTKNNYFREHFKFGAGVGTGYGFFTRKPDVFLGFGFYYCF